MITCMCKSKLRFSQVCINALDASPLDVKYFPSNRVIRWYECSKWETWFGSGSILFLSP